MKRNKKVVLWVIVGILAIFAIGTFPSFSAILAVIIGFFIAPLEQWQSWLRKCLPNQIKTISVAVLSVLMVVFFPQSGMPISSPNDNSSKITETTFFTTENITTVSPATPNTTTVEITTDISSAEVTISTTEEKITTTTPATVTTTVEYTTVTPEPPHTHSFSNATCLSPATCSCGATDGNALDHSWKMATCTEAKFCTVCGTTDGVAIGHNWKDATCTSPMTCTVCEISEGDTASHNWKDVTCTEPKTCTVCGTTDGVASGHNWKDATYSAPKTCTYCGVTEGSSLTVPGEQNYHGHVYTGGEKSEKFHYEAHCAGKYSHEINWEEVDRRDLGPCGTCVLK